MISAPQHPPGPVTDYHELIRQKRARRRTVRRRESFRYLAVLFVVAAVPAGAPAFALFSPLPAAPKPAKAPISVESAEYGNRPAERPEGTGTARLRRIR